MVFTAAAMVSSVTPMISLFCHWQNKKNTEGVNRHEGEAIAQRP